MNQNLSTKQVVFFLGAGVLGVALAAWWNVGATKKRTTQAAPPAPSVTSKPLPEPPPPPEPSPKERLAKLETLESAIRFVKPEMTPESEEIPKGAAWLASWMSDKFSWKELERIPETTHGKVMKDPELERGSRLCFSGTIVQIERDKSAPFKVWTGVMSDYGMRVVRFVALNDTGSLVNGSQGRFCGIVAGRNRFPNVSGGETQAVLVVGMFDLPATRKGWP